MAFTVWSDSFKDGDYLAKDHILSADFGFGCEGGNKSPHLAWSGAPAGTKMQIPVHRGQSFRGIADSIPVIADSF